MRLLAYRLVVLSLRVSLLPNDSIPRIIYTAVLRMRVIKERDPAFFRNRASVIQTGFVICTEMYRDSKG